MQIPTQKSRILCFHLDGPHMRLDTHQCWEASNSSRFHPSGHHGNTSRRSSKFKKIPSLLCWHGVGRQLAPIRTTGQHRLDVEILDKEIVCIQFASVRTPEQHRSNAVLVMAITFRQCNSSDSRAAPFGRGLNLETHEECYGKAVAQLIVRMPPKGIWDRLDLGLLCL
jgi:hypothetical protein